MTLTDYIAAAPEIILLGLICAVMIADLFVEDEEGRTTFWLTMASLAVVAIALYMTTPGEPVVAFYGAYVSDAFSQILKLATVLFVAISFLYARDYLIANGLNKGEYYLLGLFGLLGMMIMMSAHSLLTMYLGLETLALSMYALVAIDRNNVTSARISSSAASPAMTVSWASASPVAASSITKVWMPSDKRSSGSLNRTNQPSEDGSVSASATS